MGCWNGTCFLSNLSIRCGDPIKLQFLTQDFPTSSIFEFEDYDANTDPRDINGNTYTNDIYTPFAPVISGKYNDYGSMDHVVLDTSLLLFKAYVSRLVESKKIVSLQDTDSWISRDRESPNVPKGMDATTPVNVDKIDEFIDLVERGCIIVKSVSGYWTRLRFVMMHEDIYNKAISIIDNTKSESYEEKGCIGKLLDNKKKKFIDFAVHGKLPKKIDDDNACMAASFKAALEKNNIPIDEKLSLDLKVLLSEILWTDFSYSEYRISCLPFVKRFIMDDANKESIEGIVDSLYDFLKLTIYLSKLRKTWELTGGTGSQDDNTNMVIEHSKAILKFAKEYRDAFDKECNS